MEGYYSRLSYNINNGVNTKQNRYGGTGITLTAKMRSRMTKKGSGGNPTMLGRWSQVCIGVEDDIPPFFSW